MMPQCLHFHKFHFSGCNLKFIAKYIRGNFPYIHHDKFYGNSQFSYRDFIG